jgi:hypothetical protein
MQQTDRPQSSLLMRLLPSLASVAVYGLFIAIWRYAHPLYEPLVGWFDATPDRPPFGDLSAILLAGQCARTGVNVYLANACMGGGSFNYSPFMLHSVLLPFSEGDTNVIGLVIAALFFIACACLPPARSPGQLAVRCLAVCSGMVMYGLECANFDTVIFTLLTCAVLLLLRPTVSLAAYVLFALGAAWKFYPVVLLSLVLRERAWRLTLAGAVLLAGGIWFLWHFGQQSHTALETLPGGLPFRGGFSAMNLPFGLALLAYMPAFTLDPDKTQYFAAIGAPHFANIVVLGQWGLVGVLLLAAWGMAPRFAPVLAQLDAPRRLFLLAGGLLIAFCYCMAQNYDYRGVFLLFALPALQAMDDRRSPLRWLAVVVLLLLWEAPLRQAVGLVAGLLGPAGLYIRIGFWLLREIFWCGLVLSFCAIVFAALRAGLSQRFRLGAAP